MQIDWFVDSSDLNFIRNAKSQCINTGKLFDFISFAMKHCAWTFEYIQVVNMFTYMIVRGGVCLDLQEILYVFILME